MRGIAAAVDANYLPEPRITLTLLPTPPGAVQPPPQ